MPALPKVQHAQGLSASASADVPLPWLLPKSAAPSQSHDSDSSPMMVDFFFFFFFGNVLIFCLCFFASLTPSLFCSFSLPSVLSSVPWSLLPISCPTLLPRLLQQPEFTDREGTAECCSSHRNAPYQPSTGTLIIPILFPSCQLTNCLHDDLYSSPYPEGEICSLLMHIHPSLQDFSARTQPSWHMTRCDFCAVTSACPLPSPIRVRSTLVPLTPTTAT